MTHPVHEALCGAHLASVGTQLYLVLNVRVRQAVLVIRVLQLFPCLLRGLITLPLFAGLMLGGLVLGMTDPRLSLALRASCLNMLAALQCPHKYTRMTAGHSPKLVGFMKQLHEF